MIYISQVILQIFHSLQKQFAVVADADADDEAVCRRNETRRK